MIISEPPSLSNSATCDVDVDPTGSHHYCHLRINNKISKYTSDVYSACSTGWFIGFVYRAGWDSDYLRGVEGGGAASGVRLR
jgi:hypothetical protein